MYENASTRPDLHRNLIQRRPPVEVSRSRSLWTKKMNRSYTDLENTVLHGWSQSSQIQPAFVWGGSSSNSPASISGVDGTTSQDPQANDTGSSGDQDAFGIRDGSAITELYWSGVPQWLGGGAQQLWTQQGPQYHIVDPERHSLVSGCSDHLAKQMAWGSRSNVGSLCPHLWYHEDSTHACFPLNDSPTILPGGAMLGYGMNERQFQAALMLNGQCGAVDQSWMNQDFHRDVCYSEFVRQPPMSFDEVGAVSVGEGSHGSINVAGLSETRRSAISQSPDMAAVHLTDQNPGPVSKPKPNSRIPCSLCGATFGRRADMRRHQNEIHAGVRRFACCTCGRLYFRSDHLKSHMRTHNVPGRPSKKIPVGVNS